MKKSLNLVFVLLLLLTITTACVSSLYVNEVVAICIMVFATLKFLLVAFQFMELKKAHSFWKISLFLTLGLFTLLIFLLR